MALKYDLPGALLGCRNAAIVYFTRRDLLGKKPGPVEALWELPAVQKILKRQRPDGSWWEPEFTGTGFPRVFYLRYHMYPLYFPLLALGRLRQARRGEWTKS